MGVNAEESGEPVPGDGVGDDSRHPVVWLFDEYARPYWKSFVGGLTLSTAEQFPSRLQTVLIGVAIDAVLLGSGPFRLPLVPDAWLPTGRSAQLRWSLALLFGSFVAVAVLNFTSRRVLGRFTQAFQHEVRTEVFDTVQRLEMDYFDSHDTGEVMSVLNDDVQELQSLVGGVLARGLSLVTVAVASYAYLLWLNWQLAVVLSFVPVVLFGMSYGFSRWIEPKQLAVRERVGDLNSRLNNNIDGVSVIKAFGTESTERERVRDASRDHREAQWDAHWASATMDPVTRAVSQLARVVTLVLGGVWVISGPPLFFTGALTPGALYVFYRYVGSLMVAMQGVAEVVDAYQTGKAAATRLQGVVEHDNVVDRPDARELTDPDGAVAYDDVTFTYPSRDEPTLSNVSFDAAPGETVGIVGPTGAGKSTVLKLLLRYYEADRGTIRVDGTDVRDVTVESLRESVGYVSQDPFLFYGTVRENVAYARPEADDEAVVEAAKLAGAHEFVADLPDGYDTMVGERGVKLSGGQRQRVAIARAILRDPAILVLDEATSHVDNETEVLIQRTLEELAADRTTFVVAHRLSTVRDADRILVVDDGEIAERGTHEQLLERDGLYANLWHVQVGDVTALPDAFLERVRRGESA
ncbi:ABC transporter ATP-binding protein [Halosimplex pelagicum]|uniref:ABC transporter ATP-binding protein n=1 Tax=Halosimplex pelagicum TaxID=869886 RepID=A0A7D5P4D3_9EURY|nr:ABC transporter ATP-binding protein [Halosimplex pelagicum]QLH80586.1 ABC transporter ATP-binding protein [Halosimplex pelagicum]